MQKGIDPHRVDVRWTERTPIRFARPSAMVSAVRTMPIGRRKWGQPIVTLSSYLPIAVNNFVLLADLGYYDNMPGPLPILIHTWSQVHRSANRVAM